MNIAKIIFSYFGLYYEKITPKEKILELIKLLKPIKSQLNLIRLGSENDGGYLVPDDLKNIKYNFSPGVGNYSDFENDLLKYGIKSYMADYSVNLKKINKNFYFVKKYIGPFEKKNYLSINSWIETAIKNDKSDLIMQMDIEGDEYQTLLSLKEDNLKKIRIIILELHNLREIKNIFFYKIVRAVLEKLNKYFYVCHIHPNNTCGLNIISKIPVPNAIEVTLIRKDRVKKLKFNKSFPHPQDRPCSNNKKEILLPKIWFN
jgi:hypothetical protein